jgi:LemA protein
MSIFLIVFILLLIAVVYVISTYNSLQKLKTQIEASIQEIGNQLKRQASLSPNLQEAVKGYMGQEKQIFQMLTDTRKQVAKADESGNMQDIDQAIEQVQTLVPRMNVILEDNPEIKSDQTIIKFMNELTDTADKLSYARRSVIDLTQGYNQRLVSFPSNIIANLFGFKREAGITTPRTGAHVEVSSQETESPKVDLS